MFKSLLKTNSFLLTSDELGTGVFIDLCHINYCASLLGVAECAQAFLDVASCWADSGNHGCFGITTETLFQQPVAEKFSFESLLAITASHKKCLLYLEYA